MTHLPEDPTVVWGPYCSEECTCYAKICCGCKKDFIVDDHTQIKYFGEGRWYCTDCATSLVACDECGKSSSSKEVKEVAGGKKICSRCFNSKYFTCIHDGLVHPKSDRATERTTLLEIAMYPSLRERAPVITYKSWVSLCKPLTPEKVGECKCCRDIVATSTLAATGYCKVCRSSESAKVCPRCDKYHHNFKSVRGYSDGVCVSCASKDFVKCSLCYHRGLKSEQVTLNGFKSQIVCKSCGSKKLSECDRCLKLFSLDNGYTHTLKSGKVERICNDCECHVNYCSSCKEYHYEEGECRSKKCGTGLMGYSYRPHLIFNHGGNLGDKIFFGFENEINFSGSSDNSKSIKDIYGNYTTSQLYVKGDGSIDGYGYECVSMPMNLAYFRKMDLDHMFKVAPKTNDSSCGLHVHVSRESLSSDVHIYKLVAFINNNEEFITKVAGRTYTGYAKKLKGKASEYVKNKKRSKYSAVNISPRDTVEIRIFKGAKTVYELRYRVEFVHALVTFTRTTSLKAGVPEFKEWVSKRKGVYPSLCSFIKTKG